MTEFKRPQSLKPGDTIGIVAPSSLFAKEELFAGIAHIEARGYRVIVGDHVLKTASWNNYLAGEDAQRASDLQTMLTRDDIQAVFCAGGGYGAIRLLPRLDWERIAQTPKIFVGYSDITTLHLALNHFGWVTFHAPMARALPKLDSDAQNFILAIAGKYRAVGNAVLRPGCDKDDCAGAS